VVGPSACPRPDTIIGVNGAKLCGDCVVTVITVVPDTPLPDTAPVMMIEPEPSSPTILFSSTFGWKFS